MLNIQLPDGKVLQFQEKVRHQEEAAQSGSSSCGPANASKQVRYSQVSLQLALQLYRRSRIGYTQLRANAPFTWPSEKTLQNIRTTQKSNSGNNSMQYINARRQRDFFNEGVINGILICDECKIKAGIVFHSTTHIFEYYKL